MSSFRVATRIGTGLTARAAAIVAAGAALFATAAAAQTSASVTVQGTLKPACSVALGAQPGTLNLATSGQTQVPMTVDCNAPFAYALTSANGGLLTSDAAVQPGSLPFASLVPYRVTSQFQTDNGTFGDADLVSTNLTAANASPCVGAAWSPSCPFSHSGQGAAAVGLPANLSIAWTPPAEPLIAGAYTDILVLTVRVR